MLQTIPTRNGRRRVFRLANIPLDALRDELQFDAQSNDELQQILAAVGYRTDLDELCDGPFRPTRRFRRRTRFSDGSFPVFYSSLDIATAEAEVKHWFPRFCGSTRSPRTAYYHRFQCAFRGTEKDLRPQAAEWPGLVDRSDYTFCNQLGAEAVQSGLAGLVTPSARHDGANLPVFRRDAVSDPELLDLAAVTFDPNTGETHTETAIFGSQPDR